MQRLTLTALFLIFCFTGICSAQQISLDMFSLNYGGKSADLTTFQKTQKVMQINDTIENWQEFYTAPDGKLQITLEGTLYKKYSVFEYTISLTNLSQEEETAIVSDFQSHDFDYMIFQSGGIKKTATLNTLRGSQCVPEDFSPVTVELAPGESHTFATPSGRSSSEYMPFIELQRTELLNELFAVSWTGHWVAQFTNIDDFVNVKIGMGKTHFKLLPGETVMQPSITIFMRFNQSRNEFKTTVHRFMLEHKVPRDSKGEIIPPVLAVASGGGNKTPEMMLNILKYVVDNKFPFDTYWIDAGWYGAPHEDELYSNCGPNWARFVGDWRVNTTTHPTGTLLPIAEAVHKHGMRLLLWFEPERVADGMPILGEHPEYFHHNLLDMGNSTARKWISDTVYHMIEKHGINVYRQDFNMDPGGIWAGLDNESPDRVGIAEAKHIAGLYEYMDEMRKRFPDILQENCASGGRRLDINMLTRAHAYCRSDYYIGQKPNDTAFILGQNATLNTIAYLPFQGCEFNCVPVGDDYGAFSIISSGTVITFSDFDGGIIRRDITPEETKWFKKIFDTAQRMKAFYTGNFYPLTDETPASDDCWCGWQFDRDDLGAGFALVFRRGKAAEESKTFELGNIDPNADYELESFNGTKKIVKGNVLQSYEVKLNPRSFELIFYKKTNGVTARSRIPSMNAMASP